MEKIKPSKITKRIRVFRSGSRWAIYVREYRDQEGRLMSYESLGEHGYLQLPKVVHND